MSDLLSPLRRAERWLAVRMHELERQLPADGKDHPLWIEYRETVTAFARVREQIGRPPQALPERPRRPGRPA
jgi:hypothetical protein